MQEQTQQHGLTDVGFLDRDNERRFLHKLLSDMHSGKSSHHILNVWGVAGIGKTTLLREGLGQLALEQHYKFIYIGFEPGSTQPLPGSGKITNLRECLRELYLRLEHEAMTFTNSTPAYKNINKEGSELELLEALRKDLANSLEDSKLVLVFDGLIQTEIWFSQIEEHLLSPLINKGLFLVIGSRSPVRLDRFELRLQLNFYHLKPMENEAPGKSLTSLNTALARRFGISQTERSAQLEKLCLDLEELSGLHPGILVYLLSQPEFKNNLSEASAALSNRASRLKILLMQFVLDQYLGSDQTEQQEQLKLALREMAIYRRFDAGTLQNVAATATTMDGRTPLKPYAANAFFFASLSQNLVSGRMVDWDAKRRGFVTDESYRRILVAGLEAENPTAYRERHKAAVQHYISLLQSRRGDEETRAIYVIELIYHLLQVNSSTLMHQLQALNQYLELKKLPAQNIFSAGQSHGMATPLPGRAEIQQVFRAKENVHFNTELRQLLLKTSGNDLAWLTLRSPDLPDTVERSNLPEEAEMIEIEAAKGQTDLRFIVHKEFRVPLLGYDLNNYLNNMEEAVRQDRAGQVFYIEGAGGTGKSEMLTQLENFIRQRLEEPDASTRPPLFGGIVDLYDYPSWAGRGIERKLIYNWIEASQANNRSFSRLNNPGDFFQDYLEGYSRFQRMRYATPNFQGTLGLGRKRRDQLEESFKEGLRKLSEFYLPIICLDTAELLEDEEGEDSDHITDTLEWLRDLLNSEVAQRCLFFIAGRSHNELGKEVRVAVSSTSQPYLPLRESLHQVCHPNLKFRPLELTDLQADEIKAYIYWYYLIDTKKLAEKEKTFTSQEAFVQEAKHAWKIVVTHLKELQALPEDLRTSSAPTRDEVLRRVLELTSGKPLWLDWLCQIAFKQVSTGFTTEQGKALPFTQADFKRALSEIIVGNYELIKDPTGKISPAKIKQVLCYACIARKGLDADTISILAAQHNPITREEAARIIELLKENPFIKVRVTEAGQSLIYLHDEIFQSLSREVEQALGLEFIKGTATVLGEAYSTNATYLRSVKQKRQDINEIRQLRLLVQGPNLPVQAQGWFDDQARLDSYLQEQVKLQHRLVERLYYRLRENFEDGYDEYCIVALMAIVEYEVGLDTLLKKEYVRYEVLQKDKMEKEGTWKDFARYREPEGFLRRVKRNFRDSKSRLSREKVVDELSQVARLARENLEQLSMEVAPQKLDEITDPALCKLRDRLKLCWADALISVYDYHTPYSMDDLQVEQESHRRLHQAIELARQVEISPKAKKQLERYVPGEKRPYILWQKHILLGRAYHSLGQLYRQSWNLGRAVNSFLQAIEHFKEAVSRVEVYLNDTRNSLALTYNLFGMQSVALEANDLALQSQLRQGNKLYVALAEDMRARILLGVDQSLTEAYTYSLRALQHLTADLEESEWTTLDNYWSFKLRLGEISRRLGRHFGHASYEQAMTLHHWAIEHLKAARSYFFASPSRNIIRRVQALNELGTAYRSLGRTLQEHIENLKYQAAIARDDLDRGIALRDKAEIEKVRDQAFDQAESLLREAQKLCDESKYRDLLWYYSIDNSHDQAQLATYRYQFQDSLSSEAVDAILEETWSALKKLRSDANPASSTPLDHLPSAQLSFDQIKAEGKEVMSRFLMGRNRMQFADWAWKRYIKEEKQADQHLRDYITYQVEALDWFIKFQPQILINEERDYSHDLSYIARLATELNDTLNDYKERLFAAQIIKDLLKKKETAKGARLFTFILDLSEEVGIER